MNISIVIPTFNRAEILHKTLEALANQEFDFKKYEILVIDDGSNDNGKTKETVEKIIKENEKLDLKYYRQNNAGQASARMLGIKNAKYEILLILGDDIIPANKHFISEHAKYFSEEKGNIAILGFTDWHPNSEPDYFAKWLTHGSCILNKYGGHQFAYEKLGGDISNKDSFGKKVKKKWLISNDLSESGHVKYADYNFFYTSNISIKKSLLTNEEFDTNFKNYGWEDIELGYRLEKKHGLKIRYNPFAIGLHLHKMTEKDLENKMKQIGESLKIFKDKYPEIAQYPSDRKIMLMQLISSKFALQVFHSLSILSKRFLNWYYFALSKKYFLQGLNKSK